MTGWKKVKISSCLRRFWGVLRALSGDDAYERYLEQWARHHADEDAAPLDRKSFFKARQDQEWKDIRRCC